MERVSAPLDTVQQSCWDYLSAVVYSKPGANLQSLRNKWTNSLSSALSSVKALPACDGDVAYRDTVVSYLNYFNAIIVNELPLLDQLKAESENSYEAAEKYYNEMNSLNAIFQSSSDRLRAAQKRFAERNNITLYSGASVNVAEKIQNAIKLNRHYYSNYLAFFKPNKEEEKMLAAFDKNDIAAAAAIRANVEKFAYESLAKLNAMEPFNKDATLIAATKNAVNFYLLEAKTDIPVLLDYFEKSANFEKAKETFTRQQAVGATAQQSEVYNKAVQEINAAAILYNKTIEALNSKRRQTIDDWNNASAAFLATNAGKKK